MKYTIEETFESWSNRVVMYEKGRALQQIAEGRPIEEVLEEMSQRITDKLLHPILKVISDSVPTMSAEQLSESRQCYETIMQNVGRAADHVEGHLFDNSK